MKRLAITLENYDDSKIVCASLLAREEEPATSAVLKRSGVMFAVDEVRGPLFHYRLDDHKSYVDLQLRTKAEISEWIDNEPFAETVRSFLESESAALRLSLDHQHAFLEISRQALAYTSTVEMSS
jgi:hypothetical protein